MMPNLGPFEIAIIAVIVIAIFGVGKLPELGGALGKGIREFRGAARDDGKTKAKELEKGKSEAGKDGETDI